LAVLRNEALAPLWHGWEDTTAVVYFNDVFLNPTDILELLHQHFRAGEAAGRETGITSGLDWWKKKPEYYYDVWVGRTVSRLGSDPVWCAPG
jgi:alpha-1,3-mannosyltransferase